MIPKFPNNNHNTSGDGCEGSNLLLQDLAMVRGRQQRELVDVWLSQKGMFLSTLKGELGLLGFSLVFQYLNQVYNFWKMGLIQVG